MKTFRVYAQIQYRDPKFDEHGFPCNKKLQNHNPHLRIISEEMEELVAEVEAEDLPDVERKLVLLRRDNLHVMHFATDEPGCSVVEL
jgi:hypothetical protein